MSVAIFTSFALRLNTAAFKILFRGFFFSTRSRTLWHCGQLNCEVVTLRSIAPRFCQVFPTQTMLRGMRIYCDICAHGDWPGPISSNTHDINMFLSLSGKYSTEYQPVRAIVNLLWDLLSKMTLSTKLGDDMITTWFIWYPCVDSFDFV